MPPKSEEAGQYSGSIQATVDSREMAKHVADLSLASEAKPAKFHGRPDSEGDVESWLRTFRRYGKALEYDDKRMLQVVPMFLGGFAATWYDCETENDSKPFPSWEVFVKAIVGRFRPPDLITKYKQDLRKRHQGRDEDVSEYFNDKTTMCYLVNPKMLDGDVIEMLREGLYSEIA